MRVRSPDGTLLVVRQADGDGWQLVLRLPDHREISLRPDATDHAVLGRCDEVLGPDGRVLALGSTVDWRRPTTVPALDRPGALPLGAGTALLNLLAWQAERAGTGPLRYDGPYPSEALWDTLRSSFRVDGDVDQARATFLADAEARMLASARTPIEVPFVPSPHVWSWTDPRVCVQHRRGIERVYVDGRPFDRDGLGPWRLFEDDDELVAGVELAGERWVEIVRLDPQGRPRGEPSPLPAAPADLVGTPLPEPVVAVLGDVLVAQAPRLLQVVMREQLSRGTIRWGDTAPDLVRASPEGLRLHAAVVSALPTEPAALLGVLVQLLQPVARRAAAASLAASWAPVDASPR